MSNPLIPDVAGYRFDSAAGLCAIALLIVLRSFKGPRTKLEVIEAIKEQGWFDLKPEDKQRYPEGNTDEPRWVTLVCWARSNCADHKLMHREQRDAWESTTEGRNLAAKIEKHFRESIDDLRKCWWWLPQIKVMLNPFFVSSYADALRPPYVYEDYLPEWRKSVRGKFEHTPEGQIENLRNLLDKGLFQGEHRQSIEDAINKLKQLAK